MAQGEFLWCDLATFGVDAALATYGHLLDWEFRSEEFADGSIYYYASNNVDVTAGIYEMPAVYRRDGMASFWMGYVGVDNITDSIDVAEAAGGRVILGPASFGQGAAIAMIADPDGAILTLFSGSHLQHRRHEMNHGGHFWNELHSRDIETCKGFYGQLFGWKFEENGATINVRNMADAPTATIHQLTDDTPSGREPHWAVSFSVSDLSVIERRCQTSKVSAKRAAGILNSERICITDENGASFYVIQAEPRRMSWFT